MRAFTSVVYGIIDMELVSALHIGTGSDAPEDDIARDHDGHYILPATAIAGVSLHYIRDLQDPETPAALDLMGNPWNRREGVRQESRVYYYDAVCDNVQIEQRTSVGMNHARGIAQDTHLYRNLFLSPGMTTSLRLQIFVTEDDPAQDRTQSGQDAALAGQRENDAQTRRDAALARRSGTRSERDTAQWLIQHIAQGYHSGKITMGRRTSAGAGRFRVTGIHTRTVDLRTPEGLEQYLQGVEACYDRVLTEGTSIDVDTLPVTAADGIDTYTLQAYCPQGLLVRSGERMPRMGSGQTDNVDVNMFYTMPQELDGDREPELHYFIPGTSIKGVLRTYAERVYAVLGLDPSELSYLFGPYENGENEPGDDSHVQNAAGAGNHRAHARGKRQRRKSCIYTVDTNLQGAITGTHHRIRIDRVLGSVMDGALMEEEILYLTQEHPFTLEVMIDSNLLEDLRGIEDAPDPDILRARAQAILFLAMRDLGTGRVALGSGSSIGHGRLRGMTLTRNSAVFPITGEKIDCGDHTEEIKELLNALQQGGIQA